MTAIEDTLSDAVAAADDVAVNAQITKLRASAMNSIIERLRKLSVERAFWQRMIAARGWQAKLLTKSRMRYAADAVDASYEEDLQNAFTDKAKDLVGLS